MAGKFSRLSKIKKSVHFVPYYKTGLECHFIIEMEIGLLLHQMALMFQFQQKISKRMGILLVGPSTFANCTRWNPQADSLVNLRTEAIELAVDQTPSFHVEVRMGMNVLNGRN